MSTIGTGRARCLACNGAFAPGAAVETFPEGSVHAGICATEWRARVKRAQPIGDEETTVPIDQPPEPKPREPLH